MAKKRTLRATTPRPRSPQDLTLRNLRAAKARLTALEARVELLEQQMAGGPLPVQPPEADDSGS